MGKKDETTCIFCDILAGKDPKQKIVHKSGQIAIMPDYKPASTYHFLVIPQKHINDVTSAEAKNVDLITEMFDEGVKYLKTQKGLRKSWKSSVRRMQ